MDSARSLTSSFRGIIRTRDWQRIGAVRNAAPSGSSLDDSALQWRMAALTRKRVNHRPVTWCIDCAGVRVGMIVERSGIANTAEPWE